MPATWTATLWTDDLERVDHSTIGSARLIWQYRGSQPRIQAALAAYLDDIQDIEDVALDVLVGLWPLTAEGVQLDTLGRIVQQPRGALTDDQYRQMILGRIYVNLSDGRIHEVLEMLEDILGISETIIAHEYYPAEVVIDVTGEEHGGVIGDLVLDWAPAGVSALWVWNEEEEEDCFAMGDTLSADETNTTGGFGDLTGATQTTGGQISGSAR